MSSDAFEATLDLAPRASAGLHRVLFYLHVIPIAVMALALGPGLPLAVLTIGVGTSWMWLRRHPALGFGPAALTRLTWHADGPWTVHDAAGQSGEARLTPDSLLHPNLLVLNFELKSGGRRTRVLLGDELDPEPLRRLRARLALVQRDGASTA